MDFRVAVTGLLALILYLNTLDADFAYDDSRAIVKNPDLQSNTGILQLFYNDFWGTPLTHSGSHKSYRPLCVLTFRINHALGGLNPAGYHLGNILLHAIVTATFTYVIGSLTGRRLTAAVSGALFAAHPVHTEAVAGVVGRAELLACLFYLLSLLSYKRYCKFRDKIPLDTGQRSGYRPHGCHGSSSVSVRWCHLLLMVLLTTCSMLSKEQGVTVLAICALYDVFLHSKLTVWQICTLYKRQHRGLLEGLCTLLITGLVLVGFRIYFMGNKPPEFAPADNPASDAESFLTRTLTFNYLPFVNLWLLLCPYLLSFDWSMDAVPLVETFSDPRNLCTVVMYTTIGYAMWYIVNNLNGCPAEQSKHSNLNGKASNGHARKINSSQSTAPRGVAPGGAGGTSSTQNTAASGATTRQRRSGRRNSNSSTDSIDDYSATTPHGGRNTAAQRRRHDTHILLLALAILIVPFIPASNLFFYVGFVIAERILYIPSVGFCLLVGHVVEVLYQRHHCRPWRRQVLCLGVGLLLVAYSCRTVVRNRDWVSEEQLYRSGISINPAKAWGNLANILNGQQKYSEAEEAYKEALRHRSNMADVHYNLGILLQEQKRYDEAIESYLMAIKCRPKLSMAYLNLGIVYGHQLKYREAELMYGQCANLDTTGLKDPRLHESTKISALYNHGRLLADQEKFHEAIDIYKLAVHRRPSHYAPQSLYNMLGESYYKLGQHEQAERWYMDALEAKSDHIPAHLTMAKLLHSKGQTQEAEIWYEKAKQIDPRDSSVYQHYGQYLGEVGRYSEAADSYLQASEISPTDFELVFNTANALRQASRNDDAEVFYRRAVQLRPQEATAHMNLGAMLHFNQKLSEAELSYQTALKLRPDDHVTQANLHKLRNLINKAR